MKYWLGAGCFVYAAYFVWQTLRHRAAVSQNRRALMERGVALDDTVAADSMAAFGEIAAPVVIAALCVLTLTVTAAFFTTEAAQQLSLFDLGGIYAVLLGYGTWLWVRTHVRAPSPAGAADGRERNGDGKLKRVANQPASIGTNIARRSSRARYAIAKTGTE